jgi:cell division protein FtsZ
MSDLETKPSAGQTSPKPIAIKVIGVGSAGCNAVECMAEAGLDGVGFAAVNTHLLVLSLCHVTEKVLLGSKLRRGLGTGGDPEQGRAAAEADMGKLRSLCEGRDVVFLVAGMGGGTGGGAGPVLARIAKEAGALVLGIVTLPFEWEGLRRQHQARLGLEQLKEAADAVITVPNQRITKLIDENASILEAFDHINHLLAEGVRGIWRLLTQPSLIQINFADLCAVTKGQHVESSLATAEAMGENRACELIEKLLAHPLLEGERTLASADAVLMSLVGGPDLSLAEIKRVMEQVNHYCNSARLVLGAAIDPTLTNRISATLLIALPDTRTAAPSPPGAVRSDSRLGTGSCVHVANQLGIEIETPASGVRSPSRIVAPPPALSPERAEELYLRQAVGSLQRKGSTRWRQGHLALEVVSKGRFDKSEPTVLYGEDLDVPTFVRRGVPLN